MFTLEFAMTARGATRYSIIGDFESVAKAIDAAKAKNSLDGKTHIYRLADRFGVVQPLPIDLILGSEF